MKPTLDPPAQPYLLECLAYEGPTGNLLWKERPRDHFASDRAANIVNGKLAGKVAGCESPTRYGARYLVVRIDKRLYKAHRLVWAMHKGSIPSGMEIDHIDGDSTNNRIENLRLVSRAENQRNLARRANKVLPTGIRIEANAYRVTGIDAIGRRKHLGRFRRLEDAIAARVEFNAQNGYHSNHGRER